MSIILEQISKLTHQYEVDILKLSLDDRMQVLRTSSIRQIIHRSNFIIGSYFNVLLKTDLNNNINFIDDIGHLVYKSMPDDRLCLFVIPINDNYHCIINPQNLFKLSLGIHPRKLSTRYEYY